MQKRGAQCPANIVRTALCAWPALILAGSLISGCAVQHVPQPAAPLPAEERSAQPAAASLLIHAEQALHAGNARKADEYLERAIRIDPQNPLVWQVLARSKFKQGQYPQTIQMARKSNSCRPDRATERSNWLLMEQAYLALGDLRKAKEAHAQAGDRE